MKTDANGDVEWIQNYGGSRGERGETIIQLLGGSFVVSGYLFSNDGDFPGMNRGANDIFVIKTDPNGNVQSTW